MIKTFLYLYQVFNRREIVDFELTLSILKLKSMHVVLSTILLGFGLQTGKIMEFLVL